MAERIRGLWRARILVALSGGPGHFNSLAVTCKLPEPKALSRILKRLQREGAVIRVVEKIDPLATSWHLTEIGHRLVGSAQALIASAAALRDEREFARSRPHILAAERITTVDDTAH
jgi:DNA-binding HxlR family transcriptional regulator